MGANLRIRVTQLDGNIPFQLVLETNSQDTGYSFDNSGFAVSDVSDSSNVNCCLKVRGQGLVLNQGGCKLPTCF